MPETHHRACTLCEAFCGLSFEVEGQRVLSVKNDPEDPFSRGFCCPKGLASGRLHHDPDRLRRPLVRDAGGELRETGWEEALEVASDGLAAAIRAHGLDAFGIYVGNPVIHNTGAMVGTELFRLVLPTRNRYSANSQDAIPHLLANYLMYGLQLAQAVPDLERTRFLLLVGANPLASNGSLMTAPGIGRRLRAIQKRGGRVVVVDPRRTETARVADEHLPIHPGRDALFLLALVQEICASGRWDQAFLERWTQGAEALPGVLEPFRPEAVAPLLGPELSPPVIRRLAAELAETERAAVYARLGICGSPYAGLAAWAVQLLNLVAGNVDRPGGMMFPEGPASWFFRAAPQARGSYATYRSPQGAAEVLGEYPAHILADQIARGRRDPSAPEAIHALLTVAGNPILSVPHGGRLSEAFAQLDCLVSLDIYPSETARLAKVVLPPRSALHDPYFDPIFSSLSVEDIARYSDPVLPPPEDGQLDEFEILGRLARAVVRKSGRATLFQRLMAFGSRFLTLERFAAWTVRFGSRGAGLNPFSRGLTLQRLRAQPHGLPTRPLEPRLRQRIYTRDGKVALAPAPYVEDLGRLRQLLEAPSDDGLLLIGRRHLKSNNSWFHNVEGLEGPRCTLWMHPEDASARGLAAGERVSIRAGERALEVELELCAELRRGVVSLPHGWGHATHGGARARERGGVNINELLGDRFDPLSGNSVMSGAAVEVAPIPAASAAS